MRRLKAYGRWVGLVDATGTIRRLQGLQLLGWSNQEIARLSGGLTGESIRQTYRRHHVTEKVRDRVLQVTAELVARGQGPSKIVAARAKAKGWVPLLAWDDIDNDPEPTAATEKDDSIDDIAVELACAGQKVKLTRAERHAAIRILHGRRYADPLIAETIHRPSRTVIRDRELLGLEAIQFDQQVQRGAA